MIAIAAVVIATLVWVALFRLPESGFWLRALTAAPLMVTGAVALRVLSPRSYGWFGATDTYDVLLGLGLATVAFAAVRWGYGPVQRHLPALTDRADGLFDLRRHASPTLVAAATIAMGTAEELLFRGVLQVEIGLAGAAIVYTALQLISGNPLLVLLGAVGGLVWGGLYAWTGSLVPGLLCHVLPIAAVALTHPQRALTAQADTGHTTSPPRPDR